MAKLMFQTSHEVPVWFANAVCSLLDQVSKKQWWNALHHLNTLTTESLNAAQLVMTNDKIPEHHREMTGEYYGMTPDTFTVHNYNNPNEEYKNLNFFEALDLCSRELTRDCAPLIRETDEGIFQLEFSNTVATWIMTLE